VYIYARDTRVSQGRTSRTVREYYSCVGDNGQIQMVTLENLKRAFPEHRFHDWLDATFGAEGNLAEYDQFHKTFKVNRLLSMNWQAITCEGNGTRLKLRSV